MDPQTILVIEDDPQLRELIVLVIRSKFTTNILEAGSVKSALELLNATPEVSCVFSDYDLGDGKSYEVYQALQLLNSNIPFVLCSGSDSHDRKFSKTDKLSSVIEKPFKAKEVVSAVSHALALEHQTEKEVPLSKYCPVKISTLMKIGVLNCDFYVKLSETKYIKLIKSGHTFGNYDFERYLAKNIEYFYFDVEQMDDFLNKYAQDLVTLSHAKTVLTEGSLKISIEAHRTLDSVVARLGLTEEALLLAEASTRLAMAAARNEPSLTSYLKKITVDRNNYLSSHSILLAHMSCIIASKLGWFSETIQFKLAFAAIVHDLTLPDNSSAMIELSPTKVKKAQDDNDIAKKHFRVHGSESANLLEKMKRSPADIDLILKTHHERPDGTGFPNHLNALTLGPLSSVFIMAHDLTNYIWLQGSQVDFGPFMKVHEQDYSDGTFKEFFDSYKSPTDEMLSRF